MTAGRPPAWNAFPAQNARVWTEPLVLATKDRVHLPVSVRNLLPFKGPGRLVADLFHDGMAELRSLADAQADIDRLTTAAGMDDALALAAMDRFQLVPVTAEGRMSLSVTIQLHLEAIETSVVRLLIESERLSLISERRWREQRAARMDLTQRALGRV